MTTANTLQVLCIAVLGFFEPSYGVKNVHLAVLEDCGHNSYPTNFTVENWSSEGNKLKFDCYIDLKEDIMDRAMILIDMQKCRSEENPDTCEKVHYFTSSKMCQLMKSPMWKFIYNSFKPPLHCPLTKGIYKSTNTTLDLTSFLLFPTGRSFWRVKTIIKDKFTDRIYSCVNADAFFTDV